MSRTQIHFWTTVLKDYASFFEDRHHQQLYKSVLPRESLFYLGSKKQQVKAHFLKVVFLC